MVTGGARRSNHRLVVGFFLALCALVGYLFWQLIAPFVVVLLTSAIAAIILSPLDAYFSKFIHRASIRAFIGCLVMLVAVVLPLFLIVVLGVYQARQVTLLSNDFIHNFDPTAAPYVPAWVQTQIQQLQIADLAQRAGEWAFQNLGTLFSNAGRLALDTMLFFISLFYFLADRKKIHDAFLRLSPFRDAVDERIIQRMILTVRQVVFGALVVSIIQGIFAAIGMTIFGVPGAVLWGAAAVIAGQVPIVGVGLVMTPAILYLFLSGDLAPAVGLLIWSVTIVGTIDNIIGPLLIRSKTHMHNLLILLSVLGGINLFGSIGFIVGPTILAALMALIELYKNGILEKQVSRVRL